MEAFRSGQIQVLVATTVVEVGVDVPNATLMVVNRAESFGLSQLHQLRGRISRGSFHGYCFLFVETLDPEVNDKLQTLEQHSSGFEVAEADFRLRGPGDILGTDSTAIAANVARSVRDVAERPSRRLSSWLIRGRSISAFRAQNPCS